MQNATKGIVTAVICFLSSSSLILYLSYARWDMPLAVNAG
jgi:hypothetical protein